MLASQSGEYTINSLLKTDPKLQTRILKESSLHSTITVQQTTCLQWLKKGGVQAGQRQDK